MDAYIDVVGGELRTLLELKAAKAAAGIKDDDAVGVVEASNPLYRGGDVETGERKHQGESQRQQAEQAAEGPSLAFVPAKAGLYVRLQGYLSDLLRPGQWCVALDIRRAHVTWTIRGASPATVLRLFRRCCNKDDNMELARYNETDGYARGLFFTPGAAWVDAVDVKVDMTGGSDTGVCTVDAWSKSTSVCPTCCPASPCLGVLFSWLPFADHGQNLKHLQAVRAFLGASGLAVKEDIMLTGTPAKSARRRSSRRSDDESKTTTAIALTNTGSRPSAASEKEKAATPPARARATKPAFVDKPHAFPPRAFLDLVPLMCFICGVALGATWISMTCAIVPFMKWYGPQVSNEMQFMYNIPILPLVIIQRGMDKPMTKAMGARAWYGLCVLIACVGNAACMLLWEEHGFKKDEGHGWFLGLCAVIGACSAVGYGAFMLLVPYLSNASNVAFRSGFGFSGVVNLVISQATGFSTTHAHADSGDQYWNTIGALVLVGLACGVYVLLDARVAQALVVRTEQVRGTRPRHRLKARSKAKVLKDVWPCVLALTLSFGAGMMVFVHFTYLPKQSAGSNIALALVYVNMICDVAGQHAVEWVDRGYFPAIVATQGGVLVLALLRVAFLFPYFAYIKTPSDFGGADDVFTSVCVAIFVLASGYVTSSAYNAAVRSVRIADRKQAVSLCSSAVFLGLYPAFLASYLMYKNDTLV